MYLRNYCGILVSNFVDTLFGENEKKTKNFQQSDNSTVSAQVHDTAGLLEAFGVVFIFFPTSLLSLFLLFN